jgi:hypothetical protein
LPAAVFLGLSQRMAIAVAMPCDRRPYPSVGQALGVEEGDVLRASAKVMTQGIRAPGLATMRGPRQRPQNQPCQTGKKSASPAPTTASRAENTIEDRGLKPAGGACMRSPSSSRLPLTPDSSTRRDVCRGSVPAPVAPRPSLMGCSPWPSRRDRALKTKFHKAIKNIKFVIYCFLMHNLTSKPTNQ